MNEDRQVGTACLLILAAIALGAALYFLRSVLVPFVLAVFLVEAVSPAIDLQVTRLRFPRTLALVVTAGFTLLVLVLVAGFVSSSVGELGEKSREYENRLNELVDDVVYWFHLDDEPPQTAQPETSSEPAPDLQEGSVPAAEAKPEGSKLDVRGAFHLSGGVVRNLFVSTASEVLGILSNGMVVLIFVLFLLLGKGSSAGSPSGLAVEIQERTRQYIVIKVWLSTITGVLVALTLGILGVDLALVFGLFAFLLNFIPSIGSIIATLLPLPIVLLQPGLTPIAQVLAMGIPATVQFGIGNVVEPRLLGQSLSLHPVAVLLALIGWGTIWGVVGMFLAVPLTAIAKIVLERIEPTRPIAALLAGDLGPLERALSGKGADSDSPTPTG